ncbi:hypothetical protein K491DRAFT_760319 [Lophiostoma macrostomum CBS 122681]|uniref:PD-(D/E)XK nuclease-like domain-containing protein n=1 Tax=Lophiostoma macrostomum CBS 122681 TaxID=1314788 RepID=A0A6A6SZN8_9PLEO|nr:hypothetical protein K491DRAFT_760319 [Lophiostoma macrostomum CBS 122681]
MSFNFETICWWISQIPGVEVSPGIFDPSTILRPSSRTPSPTSPTMGRGRKNDSSADASSLSSRTRSKAKPAQAGKTAIDTRRQANDALGTSSKTSAVVETAISYVNEVDSTTRQLSSTHISAQSSLFDSESNARLDTPVNFLTCVPRSCACEMEDHVTHQFPPALKEHWEAIEDLLSEKMIPSCVKSSLAKHQVTKDAWFDDRALSPTAEEAKVDEFRSLLNIVSKSRKATRMSRHEAAWNEDVHGQLLDVLVEPMQKDFEKINVTTAPLIKESVPTSKEAKTVAKIVDYVIAWKPPQDTMQSIKRPMDAFPSGQKSINQIDLAGACYNPAFLTIETKKEANDEEDAKLKIATWATAWIKQSRRFTDARYPPLPAMTVFGNSWDMYWIVDEGDHVNVYPFNEPIGSTSKLSGCYRILAVLRYLCEKWTDQVFIPWLEQNVLGDTGTQSSPADS